MKIDNLGKNNDSFKAKTIKKFILYEKRSQNVINMIIFDCF